jgi:hypothetical protein
VGIYVATRYAMARNDSTGQAMAASALTVLSEKTFERNQRPEM